MRILPPGEIRLYSGAEGFILLRNLLVMFVVIVCFAAALGAMAVLSRQSSKLLENVKSKITQQNEITLKRLANEKK